MIVRNSGDAAGGRARRASLGLAVLLVVTACGSGGPTQATSPGSAGTESLAATGAGVAVPITTTSVGTHNIVAVQISVGGGDPVPVKLDTGSAGLLIDSSVVGAQVSATGGPFTQSYASQAVSGSLGTAVVEIGSVATPEPVIIGLVDPSTATSAFSPGTHGILGIGTFGSNAPGLLAPNLQLAAPYNAGSTLQVAGAAGAAGTWTLGPATTPPSATTVQLTQQATPGSVPAGYPTLAKDVALCWTIGTQSSTCGPTDLDTGNDTPTVNSATYTGPGSGSSSVPSGESVSMAPSGGNALWSFTSGSTVGVDQVKLSNLGSETQFNTGLPFFYGRTITWNYSSGELLIAAAS